MNRFLRRSRAEVLSKHKNSAIKLNPFRFTTALTRSCKNNNSKLSIRRRRLAPHDAIVDIALNCELLHFSASAVTNRGSKLKLKPSRAWFRGATTKVFLLAARRWLAEGVHLGRRSCWLLSKRCYQVDCTCCTTPFRRMDRVPSFDLKFKLDLKAENFFHFFLAGYLICDSCVGFLSRIFFFLFFHFTFNKNTKIILNRRLKMRVKFWTQNFLRENFLHNSVERK